MVFKAHFMSRQNVVSLFEVSDIYFGYFKLNCGRAGGNNKLEVLHSNAIALAEHLVDYAESFLQRVLVHNRAVYDAFIQLTLNNALEAQSQVVIVYLSVSVGGHEVGAAAAAERVQKLAALIVGSKIAPIIPRQHNMVGIAVIPFLKPVYIVKQHFCSGSVLVLLLCDLTALGENSVFTQLRKGHRLLAAWHKQGNTVAEFLLKPADKRAGVYVVVEKFKNILLGTQHIALGVILSRRKLQYEQPLVFLHNAHNAACYLGGNLLEAVVANSRAVVGDVAVGNAHEKGRKLLLNKLLAVSSDKTRQLKGGEVVVL